MNSQRIGFVESIRRWWRWRTQRSRLHIYGIAEFKTLGTVIERRTVAGIPVEQWLIEDDDGRVVWVGCDSAPDLRVGDRVEVEPTFQGTAVGPFGWRVARTVLRHENPKARNPV
jgi:hypothetical protein